MFVKAAIIFLSIALFASGSFAAVDKVSLNARGYEWLGYSKDDKRIFAGLLYIVIDIDKDRYGANKIIDALDSFYYNAIEAAKKDPLHFDEDESLRIKCVKVISDTFPCKARSWSR